jgi:hypothetical protein
VQIEKKFDLIKEWQAENIGKIDKLNDRMIKV